MASPSCSHFELPRGEKLSAVVLLVAILYAVPCSAAANRFSSNDSASSSKNLQNGLVEALKQEGRYSAAATFLGAVDLNRILPESSTILVPMDEGVAESGLQFSTFNTAMPILQYHVILQRLLFHDLQQLPLGQTLQTLLPNNTVIITNNSSASFTIDDVLILHKDLFVASSTVVHGMSGVLNFALYGKRTHLPDFQPSAPPAISPDIGGASGPADQQLTPPFAGDISNNVTDSSSIPNVSSNISFTPPSTPALQTGNPSSPPLLSFPLPTPSNPRFKPPPGSDQTQVPASSVQQTSPIQFSCIGREVGTCASGASRNQVKSFTFYRFPVAALLVLSSVHFIAERNATPRLPLFYIILGIMAATPAMGENTDVAEVLRSRGGFDYAATYLEAIDLHRVLPNRSTLLVPTDAALEATGLIYNTLGAALPILQYHVITRELLFKDLQMLPVGETLETMLPKASILVTSNAAWNFTLNDIVLSQPDILCINGSAMHGIAGVLNFSRVSGFFPPATTGQLPVPSPPLPPQLILPLPESAAPFAVPFPVSHANVHIREMIGSLITGFILLPCILF